MKKRNLFVYSLLSTMLLACNLPTSTVNKDSFKISDTGISYKQYIQNQREEFRKGLKNKSEKSNKLNSVLIDTELQNKNGFKIKATSIRKKAFLLGNTPTQKSHNNINDSNIFDPSKIESLKDLAPYDGDISEDNAISSAIKINGNETVSFETDTIIIKFTDNSGLELFKSLYGAQVVDQLDGFYKLKVDINKSPINKASELLEKLNSKLSKNISNIQFSSLASFKLFIILCDFMLNNNQKISGIELNEYGKLTSTVMNIDDWSFDSPAYYPIPNNTTIIKSWWLDSTGVLTADNPFQPNGGSLIKPLSWSYSIGTGVDIAVLDTGINPSHPEYQRRISLTKNNNNLSSNGFDGRLSNDELVHGTGIINIIGAERNNSIGSVGVAPNSFISPYLINDINASHPATFTEFDRKYKVNKWTSARMLASAVRNGHKLVNISSVVDNDVQFLLSEVLSNLNIFDQDAVYYKQIDNALSQNVTVVCGAGNDGKNIKTKFPAALSDVSGLITVGGVDIVPAGSGANPLPKDL